MSMMLIYCFNDANDANINDANDANDANLMMK